MAVRVVTIAAGTITIKESAYKDQDGIVEVIAPGSLLTIEERASRTHKLCVFFFFFFT